MPPWETMTFDDWKTFYFGGWDKFHVRELKRVWTNMEIQGISNDQICDILSTAVRAAQAYAAPSLPIA